MRRAGKPRPFVSRKTSLPKTSPATRTGVVGYRSDSENSLRSIIRRAGPQRSPDSIRALAAWSQFAGHSVPNAAALKVAGFNCVGDEIRRAIAKQHVHSTSVPTTGRGDRGPCYRIAFDLQGKVWRSFRRLPRIDGFRFDHRRQRDASLWQRQCVLDGMKTGFTFDAVGIDCANRSFSISAHLF